MFTINQSRTFLNQFDGPLGFGLDCGFNCVRIAAGQHLAGVKATFGRVLLAGRREVLQRFGQVLLDASTHEQFDAVLVTCCYDGIERNGVSYM